MLSDKSSLLQYNCNASLIDQDKKVEQVLRVRKKEDGSDIAQKSSEVKLEFREVAVEAKEGVLIRHLKKSVVDLSPSITEERSREENTMERRQTHDGGC